MIISRASTTRGHLGRKGRNGVDSGAIPAKLEILDWRAQGTLPVPFQTSILVRTAFFSSNLFEFGSNLSQVGALGTAFNDDEGGNVKQ